MMSDERADVEHHTQAEAAADDTEHHPVNDPPRQEGSPMVPQSTRTENAYGAASHVERINPEETRGILTDANGKRWLIGEDGHLSPLAAGAVHHVVSYAPDDHPEGVRWPYILTRPAFTLDHVRREAGYMVWLLPKEVAAFHRLAIERPVSSGIGTGSAEDRGVAEQG